MPVDVFCDENTDVDQTKYKQCHLRKDAAIGHVEQIAWIPSKFAKLGKSVRLKEDNREGIWQMIWVGEVEQSGRQLDANSRTSYGSRFRKR